MVGLGDLAGGSFRSQALGVSGDGSIVVGVANDGNSEAFIWDASHGLRNLEDVLVNDLALNLTGWRLLAARGVSQDGLTIVGSGINPSGQNEAWLAIIPEASTGLLLAAGLVSLAARRARPG
jgi:uncharacterized membrane protein